MGALIDITTCDNWRCSRRRSFDACGWLLLVALAGLIASPVRGDDVVHVRTPTSSVPLPLRGMVIEYTGELLTLRTGAMAAERTIPIAEVVRVETDYLPTHTRGRDFFTAGKIREAEEQFRLALEDEERPWVRRELLAGIVRCALYEDDLRRAAIAFVSIIESDPRSMYWGLIPLVWNAEATPPPTEAEARPLQAIGSPLSTLIAASWNLERTGRRSPEAEAALQKLAAEADPTLQRLAQMQLWRVRLATRSVTVNEIRRWESSADDLPVSLRAGAHVLIGEAALQQQDGLKAAAEWLWIPLLHAEHRGLAAWCQLRAAEALQTAGDVGAAETLARESQHRFPDSRWELRINTLLQISDKKND